ncbi:MAG: hypothetical protein ACE5F9_08995 [Phycisphaerae bacterium]
MNRRSRVMTFVVLSAPALAALSVMTGCQQPTKWAYTGPRVYLIKGTAADESDALDRIRDTLAANEINAEVYRPDNWLKVVADIDADYDEEAILVGHGHGAFLCTQVVRHYAQRHKTKLIDAVFTIDAFNKDWPHSACQRGDDTPRRLPTPIPVGHNALKVRNFVQRNPDSRTWGTDLVSTRASELAMEHPYYWYDHYWYDHRLGGQIAPAEVVGGGVIHQTIDNEQTLVQRILRLCRKEALSPYHYTPPEHHPDVQTKKRPDRATKTPRKTG